MSCSGWCTTRSTRSRQPAGTQAVPRNPGRLAPFCAETGPHGLLGACKGAEPPSNLRVIGGFNFVGTATAQRGKATARRAARNAEGPDHGAALILAPQLAPWLVGRLEQR